MAANKRLFPALPVKKTLTTKPPARIMPVMGIPHSVYVEAVSLDGIILHHMFMRSCVLAAAAIQIDSMKEGEKVLVRAEIVGGGNEFSFEIGPGHNTKTLSVVYQAGDRIVVRCAATQSGGGPLTGAWLSFVTVSK